MLGARGLKVERGQGSQKAKANSQKPKRRAEGRTAKDAKGVVIPTGAKRSGGISQGIRRLHRFEMKAPNPLAPWGEGKGEGKACGGAWTCVTSALQHDARGRVLAGSIAANEVSSRG